jgi:hypothetical protein
VLAFLEWAATIASARVHQMALAQAGTAKSLLPHAMKISFWMDVHASQMQGPAEFVITKATPTRLARAA